MTPGKPALLLALLLALCSIPTPSTAAVSVRGALTHEREAKPGDKYEATILISNTGDKLEEVTVYQTDYSFSRDGTYWYDEPGENPRSNADWIIYTPHGLAIPAHSTSIINYTVEVPADKDLIGTYWSLLMVQVTGRHAEVAAKPPEKVKIALDHVVRYGIQIVTHIEETGEGKLRFLDTRLLHDENTRFLQVDLENVGQRWLRPTLWTELYSKNGDYVGKFEAGALRIYPDTSVRFKVDLTLVDPGEYKAVVVADCGGDDIFGATYSLIF